MLTISLKPTIESTPSPFGCFDVSVNADGAVTLTADPEAFACLAGRPGFGDVKAVRRLLSERIADAWYAAACP